MILVFTGLHGAGKSHLGELIRAEYGWSVYNKRDLLRELHGCKGYDKDWVTWYRALYSSIGPYAVMNKLLRIIPESGNCLIIDSIHNLAEWRAIRAKYHKAILAAVISPKTTRLARNGHEDKELDIQRIKFWHEHDNVAEDGCLMAEAQWAFNGAATSEAQRTEFEALLAYLK